MRQNRTITSLAMFVVTTGLLTYISCSKTDTTVAFVTTSDIIAITKTTAVGGGNVTSGGGSLVSARGICYSTSPLPTTASNKTSDSTGTGLFISKISGLSENTTYYVRAYATNSSGTAYGAEKTFTTLDGGGGTSDSVTDFDGNVYHVVTIGQQQWTVENLKVTHYSKGETIFFVSGDTEWEQMNKGAYCNYAKNPANGETYGHLYNWHAASDAKGICPDGWHVPTDSEWQDLLSFAGGDDVAGGKLKATGTLGQGNGLWQDPNAEATNEHGFTALPGGYRLASGSFLQLSSNARFWTSSQFNSLGWYRELSYKYGNAFRSSSDERDGYSIRCIKDK